MSNKAIITALFALITLAGQARTYKTMKTPVAMSHNIFKGELKASEVVFQDTATTVHFMMEYPAGETFRFVKESYLMDEEGNRYPLRSAEGLKLNSWVKSPKSGLTVFTMHFEPMPKQVQVFDFIEGDVNGAFMLLGIHDKTTKLEAPTMEELSEANPFTLPADWFTTDTITVRGRIEGYDADSFGFSSMECYFEDVFEKDDATLVLDIAADGTFEKKFQASYPIQQTFRAEKSKVGFDELPFFARPGETIDITVKKNEQGQYQCYYNNGSSKEVERWLRTRQQIDDMTTALHSFKGSFSEAKVKAEDTWQNMLYRLSVINRHDHYSPMEMQLALAEAQLSFAYALMDYVMYREIALMKQEQRDGIYYTEIVDSVEWKALYDVRNYSQLHRVNFDNPLLMVSHNYPITLNRIQYAKPVRGQQYDGVTDESGAYVMNAENGKRSLANLCVAQRELMGCDHDNIMSQLCIYKNLLSNFNHWRNSEDFISSLIADTTKTESERHTDVASLQSLSNMMPAYLATFTHPYVRQKAEEFYAAKMAQTELSTPLPANNPSADLIRHLTYKYPGRILIIDFWGMGCGPCRAAIQSSLEKRAKIAERKDVKLVFIAGEETAEGSDAYKRYVAEWLNGEATVCLTNEDFTRLQELFHFNGIPHYETITPDGRRMRDDLRVNGFHNFDYEMQRLTDRLKSTEAPAAPQQ